jgi:hypothetical protein
VIRFSLFAFLLKNKNHNSFVAAEFILRAIKSGIHRMNCAS